ncbi:MAG: glucuronate isomerase [Melioribacteraceae bacterium]|jgi:glucuronate isomerase|nr:glucuronate isomerase [Melioribacteraceae bacterium]
MLSENRYFDSNPSVRKIGLELYENVVDLPIISPHGHVDPKLFEENKPFANPTELFIIPDHYVFRMLYSQGFSLESLGINAKDDSIVEEDSYKIWQIFADNFYLFSGTPTGVWVSHELETVFGITEKLTSKSAREIYNLISKKLQSPKFLPRTLFEQFNIGFLATTDGASDSLEYHKLIKESDWNGRIVPSFRPDAVVNILAANWKSEIEKLSSASGIDIIDYQTFIKAIENRRQFFIEMGATATDQGVLSPYTHELSEIEANSIFKRALFGIVTEEDQNAFVGNMLMEMARMSCEDGLVMQIHPGVLRNHNDIIFKKFGLDKGCDIPIQTEYTKNLRELLNKYGNNSNFKLIVFTHDETSYARELAPLAGHYPAMKLGPAWWFNDSIQGMKRFREMTTETAGFYNTVGFNDETRAFLSIPARHDLARRVDCNFLALQVSEHIIDLEDAHKLSYELTNGLVKKAYNI